MHALCTIIARDFNTIQNAMDYYSENEWDYASVGGRYSNLIPVGKNCRLYNGNGWPDLQNGDFPFGERLGANPNCKYTNVARLRNVNRAECVRLASAGCLTPFEPYTLILCHEDGGFEWMDWETAPNEVKYSYREWMEDPRRQSWWMVIVDYHY